MDIVIEIPLTNSTLVALVDDEDAERVNQFQWQIIARDRRKKNSGWYAMRNEGTRIILLHRTILDAPDSIEVDHRNNNGLDNQRRNLRLATRSQNAVNYPRSPSKTGFRGVYLHGGTPAPTRRNYIAQITVNYRRVQLGSFWTAFDAAIAYDDAAYSHFGEFAILNFPARIPISSMERDS